MRGFCILDNFSNKVYNIIVNEKNFDPNNADGNSIEPEYQIPGGLRDRFSEKPEHELVKINENPNEEKIEETIGKLKTPEKSTERMERIKSMRRKTSEDHEPIPIIEEDKKLIEEEIRDSTAILSQCYKKGFGIFPSGNPKDHFYDTMWTRDLAHAGGNFFVEHNEDALLESIERVFLYQKPDGALPYRVERKEFLKEHILEGVLGIERYLPREKERPVYEGEDGGNAEDTIPATIITLGELFINSEKGREFVKNNFEKIQGAMHQFIGRTDPKDGLETSKKSNPDWSDSLLKGNNKLGTINIWYARALRMMELMSGEIGKQGEARYYREQFQKVKSSVLEKLYDKEDHYFKTGVGESRIDAAACVFGSLYLLPATEAAKVQETMAAHLKSNSGLKNFYPPYPKEKINPILRTIGMGGYHNESVWPWLTAQNIQVKIKIALEHPDEKVKQQYKKEAVEDLVDLAKLFKEAGGAYEVFDPDTRRATTKLRTGVKKYKVPNNLMGNLSAYQSAHAQLKELGWIE